MKYRVAVQCNLFCEQLEVLIHAYMLHKLVTNRRNFVVHKMV